ncbi:MAG: restriction endonuclease subunit S [Prevotella stercorea]|nr:restriction endonuclease subunit S [Leyella stercorea]
MEIKHMGLKKYALSDVCTIVPGFAFKSNDFGSGENIAVKIKDIEPPSVNIKNAERVCFTPQNKFRLSEGDYIMAMTGATIGKVGKLQIDAKNVYINQRVCKFNPITSVCDKEYLYYVLSTSSFRNFIYNNVDSKLAQPNIGHTTIYKYTHLFPSNIKEQKLIASVLNNIDRKIELNKQINDNLEAMAKQLYDYWFVQFDFPNEEGKPYKSSGGAMVWNKKLKREIPSCFEVVNMGKLCDFRNGINYSKDETGNDYQIVNVRNISSSRILLDGEDFDVITVPTSKAENYVLKPDDIIIARSGCPGSTRLLLSSANTLFCGFIICCSPNDSSMRNYLVYCLKQLEGTNATTSGGSILQNVSQDTLKGLHVIVPKKQIIDKFNKTIELIFARMLNCLKESKALTKQRDELLLLLMNGQASVNSD